MLDGTTKYIQNVLNNNLNRVNKCITDVKISIRTLQQGIERLQGSTGTADLMIELGHNWAVFARLLEGRAYFEDLIDNLEE